MSIEHDQHDFQAAHRGSLEDEYKIYRYHADDGKGGDLTNGGKPLKTFDEWMNS